MTLNYETKEERINVRDGKSIILDRHECKNEIRRSKWKVGENNGHCLDKVEQHFC
uniref:Uncharacterized protein n=1 Tax=Rhizophagus irregularis (strain DAOM 181602 / DAOM 197198 / MUCL 43194) TaxID=747089 RepID=U9UJ24_RHIID